MKQIEALWKLQEIEKELEQEKRTLKEIASLKFIDEKIQNHKEFKKTLEQRISYAQELKKMLEQLNKESDEQSMKAKEVKDKLYGGKIKDLKQLGSLMKEEESIDKKIHQAQKEIINKMEEVEKLQEEIKILERQEKEMGSVIKKMLKDRDVNKKHKENRVKEIIEERKRLIPLIEKSHMETYLYIKARKNNPIALLHLNICTGCHMDLPIVTMTELNRREMVTCNNCGRLLYIKDKA